MTVMPITGEMIEGLIIRARKSSRKRQHLNLHESYSCSVQRVLNAVGIDSYIQPHRHLIDPKIEFLSVICGKVSLLIFDETGKISDVKKIGAGIESFGCFAVEIGPSAWHTVVSHSDRTVLLEVKAGPFNPATAKEFAHWAPKESSKAAKDYHAHLINVSFGS